MAKKKSVLKQEILKVVAEETKENYEDIEYVINIYQHTLRDLLLKGEKITFTDTFSLEVVECKGKIGKNHLGQWVERKPFKKLKCKTLTAFKRDLEELQEKENNSKS